MVQQVGFPWRRAFAPVLMAAAAGVLAACTGGEVAEPVARPVMVVQPQPGATGGDVFPGEVRARHEPSLAFRLGGAVLRRHVEVGDAVEAGQVLAELDPSDAALQVESGQARLAGAEADLALAEAERDRHRALLERGLVSRSLAESAEAGHQAAAARLRQVRAELGIARNQSGYSRLRAPAAGVVAERMVEAGQVVAAGQPAFVLALDGEREVLISIPEQRRADFEPGREVAVEMWSRSGALVEGTVRERAPAADPGARTYAVRIAFDATAAGAELGQSARVHATGAGSGVLHLPLAAVSAEGDQAFAWRIDPDTSTLERQPLRLGAFGSSSVPVLEGLEATDWVVAAGVHLLHEGQAVRPVDRNNRPVSTGAMR